MKKSAFTVGLSSVALVALTLSACGKGQASNPPVTATQPPAKDTQAASTATDNWKQITNFAQSIEGADLTVDATTKTATLGFKHRTFDLLDENGAPYYRSIFELKGSLDESGVATLSDVRVPDYSAKLKCSDSACLLAEITITKSEGKQAGSAVIKYVTLENTNSFIFKGDITDQTTTQARYLRRVATACDSDPYTVNLTTKEVVGGLKNFFSIRIIYSNRNRTPQDDGYFSAKEASIAGEIGQNVLIRVGLGSYKDSVALGGSSPARANVVYDASRNFVGVNFLDNEGLTGFNAGRELFPKESQ